MHLSVRSLPLEQSLKQQVYFSKSVWKKSDENKWKSAVVDTAKHYCYTAVLHGVKYLAEPRRPHLERFSWSLVLLSLLAIALHLLWVTSVSDWSSPLLINLESSNHPISRFRFPAVTICPSGKLSRTASEAWARTMKLPANITHEELVNLLPNLLHLVDFSISPKLQQLHEILELNQIEAHELYLNLSVPCKDLLVQCRINGISHPCPSLFKTIRTTEGYCCSFNYFGVKSQFLLNRYHKPSEVTPRSPFQLSSSGRNSGLSVLLRTKGNNFGTLMSSQGIKVLLHVSTNYPDHLAIERLVQPGHSEHFALNPTHISAGPEIREVAIPIRNCYFYDEKQLMGFQQYSYKSCIFNCRIDIFAELCGCVPFYYPAHANEIRTCSLKDVPCLTHFKYQIQALRMNLSLEFNNVEAAPCDCRPQCNEYSYGVATSTYPLSDDLKTSKYGDISFFNYSEINVYFKAMFGTKYQRVQQSTTYQMLANFGGLLGLFMGFSFIAAFEIIYTFTLRILFRMHVIAKEKTAVEGKTPFYRL